MKKVFSFAVIALFAVTVLFTACRDNASQSSETQEPATEQQAAPAETQEAAPAADTTQQAQ